MKLHVNPSKTLKQIQKEFQNEFPLLKIEFFKNPHRMKEASAKKDMLDASLTIAEISKAPKGEMTITGKTKVSEVEQSLRRDYGLNAQVFRKAGNIWLETSKTDDWTLEQEQAAAKESNAIYSQHAQFC